MSAVLDVTADQPPSTGQLAVQELTPEEVVSPLRSTGGLPPALCSVVLPT